MAREDQMTRSRRSIALVALTLAVLVAGMTPELVGASKANRDEFSKKCTDSGGWYYEYEYNYEEYGGGSGTAFGCNRADGGTTHCDDEGVDNHGWQNGCDPNWPHAAPSSRSPVGVASNESVLAPVDASPSGPEWRAEATINRAPAAASGEAGFAEDEEVE